MYLALEFIVSKKRKRAESSETLLRLTRAKTMFLVLLLVSSFAYATSMCIGTIREQAAKLSD